MVYFLITKTDSSDYYVRKVSSDFELLEKRKTEDLKSNFIFSEIYEITKLKSLYFNDEIDYIVDLFDKFLFFPVYELNAVVKSSSGRNSVIKTVVMTLNESNIDEEEINDILKSLNDHISDKFPRFNSKVDDLKRKLIGYDMYVPSGQYSYSTLDLGQTDEEINNSFSSYVKLHLNKNDKGYISDNILEYPLISDNLKNGYSIESIDRFTYLHKNIINIKFRTK